MAARVRDERLRLKLSVREAAALGGISNTWWAKFEDGIQPLTEGIIAAVAQAFEWDQDWASQPDEYDELRGRVVKLERQIGVLLDLAGVEAVGDDVAPQAPSGDVQ